MKSIAWPAIKRTGWAVQWTSGLTSNLIFDKRAYAVDYVGTCLAKCRIVRVVVSEIERAPKKKRSTK